MPVPGLYHDRHPMVRSKGPPVRGPLPCRLLQTGPIQKYADETGCTPPSHRGIDNPFGRGSSSSGSSQGGTSNQDRPERFQTSPVTASNPSLETPNRARCDRSATQIQQTNSFALLGAKMMRRKMSRNDEADLFDSDEETTRIFLQQPGAVRTMQPTFPACTGIPTSDYGS